MELITYANGKVKLFLSEKAPEPGINVFNCLVKRAAVAKSVLKNDKSDKDFL